MDAKQVKYDMHDPRWLNQVYAYAYSTQSLSPARRIDFAVLSDFEEFLVIDCTMHVDNPKALVNFLAINWKCEDFVTQFDRLWEIFERDNMRRAARTRNGSDPKGLWALALSPKKLKTNRTPPDKAFLSDMDDDQKGWRVRLAKDMKKHNPQADGILITAAVQLLIDRLIFVKALSDREIEEDYLERLAERVEKDGLADSDTGWFNACRDIFDRLNKFYNGSIFQERPELENVAVSNKVVSDIIRSLQPENSHINFAVMPVEILGTIYERFLGRVVRTTEQRVKIEEKPEVRKAGGVYYTPQYIVDYIVKNTVGKLLAKCQTPEDAAKLKILDPACGSGSFLVGAYTALIEWHIRYYDGKKKLTARDKDDAYYDADGRVRLTARLKRGILLNNLFGVDIDPQAVEVTCFSLSLKALEDTDRDELHEERTLFKETVLPDLRKNIKCGNSLIGPEYFKSKMFPDPEELRRVNPFDWNHEFAGVMVKGGFDVVIGNPPYVRQESLGEEFKNFVKERYQTYAGTADLYVYFFEKGLKVLKTDGLFGMICSNKWMRANYGKALREYISRESRIDQIVDFGELPVFQGAATFPAIIILGREILKDQLFNYAPIKRLNFDSLSDEVEANGKKLDKRSISGENWTLADSGEVSIFEKMKTNGIPLGDYVEGKIFRGVLTGLNEAFVIDSTTRDRLIAEDPGCSEVIKPFVSGDDVRKYCIYYKDRFLIFTRRGIDINKYPSIERHLLQFKEKLTPRPNNWRGGEWKGRKPGAYKWYEIQDTVDYYEEFEKPKIVFPEIAMESRFSLDYNSFYLNKTCFFIPIDDKYLLGILNSSLIWRFLGRLCSVLGDIQKRGRLLQQKIYIEKIPIRGIDFSIPKDKSLHDEMVKLVETMLNLHKNKDSVKTQHDQEMIQRRIDATDRQIDALVYELYGLTAEEIAIFEGSTRK
ncbi:MAG: Eco57I restriction-modification methylase domain-containing protein [Candidatus Aminicenantes bacterium]|nr:Eco57I restriction-modification methylase domain-containing protein [Candidatus Aminicenantes bacterium]